MSAMTATAARRELFSLIRRVNENADRVEIVSKHGNAVLMSADEYEALATTAHLFSTPANARRLRQAIADAKAGRYTITVQDVPVSVRDELASRAARAEQSLQEYVKGILVEQVEKPSAEDWLTQVRDRVRSTGSTLSSESILAARDADRK